MRGFLVGLFLLAAWRVAQADVVTINVSLDGPADGTYQLSGQSAFIQTRTDSGTSGGQLDGVQSGGTAISFTELFPPASLADYLGFAYFGIMQTRDIFDDVIDSSLIIAYAAGSGVGQTVGDTFPYTEAELVSALTGSFDSPEFFDMLDKVPTNASTLGEITIPPIGRPGTELDLVAFIGGPDGDLGVKVGTLGVTVVPEPSTIGLSLIAGMVLLGVRGWRGRGNR